MIDFLTEIIQTIRQNRLRAIMTGFSVAWGIFMLLVLLGAGNGLQHGMENNFKGISTNSMFVWSGQTQIAYDGIKPGRYIQFRNEDYKQMSRQVEGIEYITGRVENMKSVSYEKEYGTTDVQGVTADIGDIVMVNQIGGRHINDVDFNESRKVAVISQPVRKSLYNDKDPIGTYIRVGDIPFLVVGIIENKTRTDERVVYLPLSTMQMVFNEGDRLTSIAIRTNATTSAEAVSIEKNIRKYMAARHHFDPEDKGALGLYNTQDDVSKAQGVFSGIRMFVWIIGIMTIIAGIMGISNIMIILVKERKKEIGIRKALGATPWSIVRLVLSESVFITIISGFLGMVAGMGLLALINVGLESAAQNNERLKFIFYNPTADVGVALSALIVLVLSGLVAGYIPASNAAAIKPIEALQEE